MDSVFTLMNVYLHVLLTLMFQLLTYAQNAILLVRRAQCPLLFASLVQQDSSFMITPAYQAAQKALQSIMAILALTVVLTA